MGKGQLLYLKAKKIIPGGTQLLSKRPEMFLPDYWPAYYKKAKGVYVWDLDNKKYIDMSLMGIGANVLGYNDSDVNKAVIKSIKKGNMTTLNSPKEIELAELMLSLHKWADMVRYARTGGESMAIAIRIARAYTQKSKVLFCGYHGWHDWYLSANLSNQEALDGHLLKGLQPSGVPRELINTSIPFRYNDIETLKNLVKKEKNNIAAIVMEPVRNIEPEKGFLEEVKNIAHSIKAVFIFDEISSGFRVSVGGAHLKYNVFPDIAVFAKAISNGYPMGVIIGKKEIMQSAQETFISSTYWTESIGPTAAIETIKKFKKNKVYKHLVKYGTIVQNIWKNTAKKYDLNISVSGIPPLSHFEFNYKISLELKTLFIQLMLERKFLASTSFYPSFTHKDLHIELYKRAVNEVFEIIGDAIRKKNVKNMLKGKTVHAGFQRLN